MNSKLVERLIFVVALELVLIPFVSYYFLINLSLINAISLFSISIVMLLNKFKGIYLVFLGYGVFSFFDIYKYSILSNDPFNPITSGHFLAIYLTFISFFLFLIAYYITYSKKKRKLYLRKISVKRIKYILIPMGLIIALFVFFSPVDSPLMLLISFFPKALTILLFYLFIQRKKYVYLVFVLILYLLSFDEISRRIYVTLFFILIPVLMASLKRNKKRIKSSHKYLLGLTFIVIFLYMNFLRSDFEYGDGYIEGDKITSTLNYMKQFKAIDTFDNTAFVLENIPNRYDFYYGESYLAIFVQFIPRSLWPNKPVGFGAPLGLLRLEGITEFNNDVWLDAIDGFSYSTGFIGEAFANFGYLGVLLLSIMFGFITKKYDFHIDADKALLSIDILPYLAFLGAFFLILRGDTLMATYFSILFFIFLKLFNYLIIIKTNN